MTAAHASGDHHSPGGTRLLMRFRSPQRVRLSWKPALPQLVTS